MYPIPTYLQYFSLVDFGYLPPGNTGRMMKTPNTRIVNKSTLLKLNAMFKFKNKNG